MPIGIYKRTKEHNRKISEALTGRHLSEETKRKVSLGKKGCIAWNKGIPMSKEQKKKVSEAKKKNPTRYWLGKIRYAMRGTNNPWQTPEARRKRGEALKGHIVSKKTRKKISEVQIGRKASIETRRKMSLHRGKERYNWKGTTPLIEQIRKCFEYRQWRNKIFIRDSWACVKCGLHSGCGKRVYLEAHHIKLFTELFTEFLQEYNQFSPFEDIDTLIRLATKWQPFWTAEGETLCRDCHNLTKSHKIKEIA